MLSANANAQIADPTPSVHFSVLHHLSIDYVLQSILNMIARADRLAVGVALTAVLVLLSSPHLREPDQSRLAIFTQRVGHDPAPLLHTACEITQVLCSNRGTTTGAAEYTACLGPVLASFTSRAVTFSHTGQSGMRRSPALSWSWRSGRAVTPIGRPNRDLEPRASELPCEEVRYANIYDGVDLVFSPEGKGLKYTLLVGPGASTENLRLAYEGAVTTKVWPASVEVRTPAGTLVESKLYVYQEQDGQRKQVAARYRDLGDGSYGFELGEYDTARGLTIDPVLEWSTFLGDISNDYARKVKVDAAGFVYVAGTTTSPSFPSTVGAFDTSHNGLSDVFVAKLTPTGSAIVWSTFLGGSGDDDVWGLEVDTSGNVYVAGHTDSTNFPVTAGAFDTTANGGQDCFVVKLNPAGSGLAWSSYIGGSMDDRVWAMTVDPSGKVYFTGDTFSSNYPTTPGAYDQTHNSLSNNHDINVTCLNADGSSLAWSTFLGGGMGPPVTPGSDPDTGYAIAVDPSGNVYVGGTSSSVDFPVTPGAYQTTLNGELQDVTVTKISAGGATLAWSTYLGGTGGDLAFGIAVDASGNVTITGSSSSSDYPTTAGAYDQTLNGSYDIIVTQLNPTGTALNWSTFVGGSGNDVRGYLAIDPGGNFCVTGYTGSPDFPTTPGAHDTTYNGDSTDVFVFKLSAGGSSLSWSSFLGGSGYDDAYGIAVTSTGHFLVVGATSSTDFPVTPGAFDTSLGGPGSFDAFVTKFGEPPSAPGALGQFRIGGVVAIPVSGFSVDSTLVFKGTLTDPSDTVKLQVEVRPVGTSFTGAVSGESTLLASGTVASVSLPGIVAGPYHWQARSVDSAGLTSSWVSFGANPESEPDFTVDLTAPVGGTVNDGTSADSDHQASLNTISANWSGFSDTESGIVSYEWAIGTTAGGTDVQPFVSIALSTLAMNSSITLANGQTYFVTIRATNGAGLQSVRTSDGVTVDSTPPTVIASGSPTSGVAPVQVTFTASASDALSGVALYQWDYDGNGSVDYSSPVSGNAVFSYALPGTYNARLTVFDVAGNSSSTVVVVTAQAPTPPAATLTATPTSGNAPLAVSFNVVNPPAGTTAYEWNFDGDLTFDRLTAAGSTGHTYLAPGTYVPVVRLVLSGGAAQVLSGPTISVAPPGGPSATSAYITRMFVDADGNGSFTAGTDPVLAEDLVNGLQGSTVSASVGQTIGIEGAAQAGFAMTGWELDFNGDRDSEVRGAGTILGLYSYGEPGIQKVTLKIEYSTVARESYAFVDVQPASTQSRRIWIVQNQIKSGKRVRGNCVAFKVNAVPNNQFDWTLLTLEIWNGATWASLASYSTPTPGNPNSGHLSVDVDAAIAAGALPNGVPVPFRARIGSAVSANAPASPQDGLQGPVILTPTTGPADVVGTCNSPVTAIVSASQDESVLVELGSEARVALPRSGFTPPSASFTVRTVWLSGNPPVPVTSEIIELRELRLEDAMGTVPITRSIRIRIYYDDADSDGLVDGTGIGETALRVVRYDGTTWVPVLDQARSDDENWVEGTTVGLSFFAIQSVSSGAQSGGGGGSGCGSMGFDLIWPLGLIWAWRRWNRAKAKGESGAH